MRWIRDKIIKVGRLLFEESLVGARSGNISLAFMDRLFITRTGSHMGALSHEDIIELPLKVNSVLDDRASVELPVHRAIILKTGKCSVVHAHPTSTLKVAYEVQIIKPQDSEGREILVEVPVLEPGNPSSSKELAEEVSRALIKYKAVVIRGHGVFSAHNDPIRAYSFISTLEHSCSLMV